MTTSEDLKTSARSSTRWSARLWIIVVVFAGITALRSWQVGVPPRDPGGEFLRVRVAITLAVAIMLALADGLRRTPPGARNPQGLVATLRNRWTRERLSLVLGGLAAYHATYFCYHQLKSWNAFRTIHDDALGSFDHWLFGDSPASLLHQLLGVGLADRALVVVYESFPTLVALAFVAPLVLAPSIREGYVAITAFVWVWILGVSCYYLIPSLGPFHQDPAAFTALPDDVVRHTQAAYLTERAHLLAAPGAHGAIAQIGAFASLHVAVTCVILLTARHFRLRRTTWAMGAHLIGTCLATVYLGWHFVSDDIAGLAIAYLAFALARVTIGADQDPVT